jgi:hypothetical protein
MPDVFKDGFHALMADGAVHFFPNGTHADTPCGRLSPTPATRSSTGTRKAGRS